MPVDESRKALTVAPEEAAAAQSRGVTRTPRTLNPNFDVVVGCFATCTDSGVGARRNTTSPCWISCFYDTVLGPDAGTPGGAVAGMPLEDLVAAWQRGFGGVDEGGCAPMPTAASAVPPVPFGKRWGFGTFA